MSDSREGLTGAPQNKAEAAAMPDVFPVGDAFLEKYKARPDATPERVETMRQVMRAFLEQEVKNTRLYHSETHEVEFPYTVIRIEDLANQLFVQFGGMRKKKPEHAEHEVITGHNKLEFVLGGFQMFAAGHEYEYAEFALAAAIKELPRMLADLEEGREPVPHAIYTLGSAVSDIGFIGKKFEKEVQDKPLEASAAAYADMMSEEIHKRVLPGTKATVELTGVSMGSSIVPHIAKALLDAGVVTQDVDRFDEKPRVEVNMYIPVANDRSKAAAVQLGVGYAAEGAYQFASDPAVRSIMRGTGSFVQASRSASGKDFPVRLDDEQRDRKSVAQTAIMKQLLGGGIHVPSGVKTNQIVGEFDPLMYSPVRGLEFLAQEVAHGGSLGENIIVSSADPNARIFGADMSHRVPFYRNTEFKHFDATAEALLSFRAPKTSA